MTSVAAYQLQNADIALQLDEVALLLEQQQANPFRVGAYRRAAKSIRRLDRPVASILETEGLEGLDRIPDIGEGLARAIRDFVTTGHLPMLDRLRGLADPILLLGSVPGIGRTLAERLHQHHGIDSLEDLELAAHDGRLARVPGIGAKKLESIRHYLAARLGRWKGGPPPPVGSAPPIEELLDVDREYRRKAKAGELRTIAPHRFNPGGQAWLPILHTHRGARQYTALFSNTARAHRLGTTDDWVVLYDDGRGGEHQHTVITAHRGPLASRRIVRGREAECLQYYHGQGLAG